jgi:SAM-dependent methyltransferase
LLKDAPCKRVLEIGCGTGLITRHLEERGYQVTAIDSSGEMLQKARARCAGTSFIEADAFTLGKETYSRNDAIIAVNVLHLCENVDVIIAKIIAALRENKAIAVLTWPTDGISHWALYRLDRRYARSLRASLLAVWLRWLIGIIGAHGKVRVNGHRRIMASIEGHIGQGVIIKELHDLENCQHIVVLTQKGYLS